MATSTEVLNLVLLGRTGVGKSSCGNTILGREVFTSKRSSRSVTRDVAVESATVGHIPVTVYDTPGLFDTEMSEEVINLKHQSILQKCESGPSAFLLVIKADRFTEEERRTVEKIENLLGEKRLEKTWILFTRGDELEEENLTIQEFISKTEPLKKLIQKYNHRYHVFNNKERGHTKQVQMLLLKILEGPEMMKQDPLMRKTLDYKPVSTFSPRRIVLLGKTGVGKSAAGNTILRQRVFRSVRRMDAVTRVCSEAHTTVSGRSVSVVDTPGFFDTEMSPEELMTEIASVHLSSPGPHAFLIVFPVNVRFTLLEQQIPQMIEMMFGEEVLKYSIILFTHGDQLEEESVEKLIQGNSRLIRLVDQCGGRYQVFNNKDLNNREQVNELLQKIDSMIEQNGGGHFSHQMFEDAHRFRREEEEMRQREEGMWRLKEKEERRQRDEEVRRLREEEEMRLREEVERRQRRDEEERRQREEEILERVREEERVRAEKKYELERLEAERQRQQKHEEKTFLTRFKHHCLVAGAVVGAAAGAVVAAPVAVVALPVAGAAAVAGAAVGEVLGEALFAMVKKKKR